MPTTQTAPKSTSQTEATPQEPPTLPNASSGDLNARLEKAMRRAELLGYAAAGLAIAILAVLIGIAFL